jgi:uncharacterized protein (TIGR00162 family)
MNSNSWNIKQKKSISLKSPVMIEGLPGIGNVGKIAVDFLTDELKAEKVYELSSYTMPHSVFINENNLAELPKIEIYYKQYKKTDFLFLCGDVQPSEEISCYEFTEVILNLCKEHGCKSIITLGGIGLMEIPKKPRLFMTGNSKISVERYKDKKINTGLYGIVGPIVGVSGLLIGMAPKSINAVALLAETYSHPMYLGVKGAKETLSYLNRKFKFDLKVEKLDKEIKAMEQDALKRAEELNQLTKNLKDQKITDVNYIG